MPLKIIHTKRTPTREAVALKKELEKLGIEVIVEPYDGYKHVDLLIREAKIEIEVDGIQHLTDPDQIIRDLNRSYHSNKSGYNTIHIPNRMIRLHLQKISIALAEASKIRKHQLHIHVD